MLASPLKFFSVFLTLVLVAGCGFQLRGSAGFPAELTPLYITEQNSILKQSLVTQFTQAEIELSPSREAARWQLWLSNVRHNKQQTTYHTPETNDGR